MVVSCTKFTRVVKKRAFKIVNPKHAEPKCSARHCLYFHLHFIRAFLKQTKVTFSQLNLIQTQVEYLVEYFIYFSFGEFALRVIQQICLKLKILLEALQPFCELQIASDPAPTPTLTRVFYLSLYNKNDT